MKQRALILLLVSVGFVGNAPAQRPPSGFVTFDHGETALRLFYPKSFQSTPTPPTEKLTLASFSRRKAYRAKAKDRHRRPSSFLVFALEPRTTPGAGGAPAGAGGKPKKESPTSYEDLVERRNDVHTWRDFLKTRVRGWVVDGGRKEVFEKTGTEVYTLRAVRGGGPAGARRLGYLYVRNAGGRIFGVVGFCDEVVAKHMQRQFRKVCESIHLPKGHRAVKVVGEDFYRGKEKKLRDIPFRVQARREMLKGWKGVDTPNFFIVHHTTNKRLVSKVANDLEAVRPVYEKLFPPTRPIDAVSVVRICRDRDEYLRYGGSPSSAGYWNFVAKELVLFDASKRTASQGRKQKTRPLADSYIVLYHEAFHQYIFYAAGEISPHDWFNEGHGDYFSGLTVYKGSSKVKGIGLNRWRIGRIKATLGTSRFIPLKRLLYATHREYYAPREAGQMYSEGWALCYFLHDVTKNPKWRAIVPTYYEALKEGRALHVDTLEDGASLAMRQRELEKVKDRALAKALKGIDLAAMEKAWFAWMKKVKDPWAAHRKKRR